MHPSPPSPITPACVVLIDTVPDRLLARQLSQSGMLPDCVDLIDVRAIAERGAALVESLRATRFNGGILIISRATTGHRVAFLEAGADHVLEPSTGVNELVAWIRSTIRRTQLNQPTFFGEHRGHTLMLCTRTNVIVKDGLRTNVTETECKILAVLLRNRGEIVHRRDLLMLVWGITCESTTNVLNAYIWSIRRKLATIDTVSVLQTSRGKGFVLRT